MCSLRESLHIAVWPFATVLLLLGFLGTPPSFAQGTDSDHWEQAGGELQGRFDVGGGRKMYLECHGEGSPTVILEAGFRNSSGIWHLSDKPSVLSVWDGVGAMTRVCAYDRPGTTLGSSMTSKSDPAPMPRTGQETARDLHALLSAAHVPGPYILVAHSMGGIFSRLYTSAFPDSIIGLVLVDALPENIAQLMGDPDGPLYLRLIVQVPDVFKDYKGFENVDLPVLNELTMRTAKEKPLRPIPLVVLARGKPIALPEGLPAGFSDLLESSWRKGQLYLASLIANSDFIVAQESDHYIQVEQPELVAGAVRRELDAIRWGR